MIMVLEVVEVDRQPRPRSPEELRRQSARLRGPPIRREIEKTTSEVEICESGEDSAAHMRIDDVVRYLMRHRINAVPRAVLHQQGSGAAQLLKFAQEEGADLIVTGAYGHSRLG